MQSFPPNVMSLVGFTLAHAVWSVCDTAPDELLTPLAFVQAGEQRELVRFEADTQVQAIEKGKATLLANADRLDAWAFAREGTWQPPGTSEAAADVLTVEFRGGAMREPAFVVQRFARAASGAAFRLLGPPAFVIGGHVVEEPAARLAREALAVGISSHPKAAELWPAVEG